MKKSQKLLIGLLIVTLIVTTAIIIFVKTDNNQPTDTNVIYVTDAEGNTVAVTQGTADYTIVTDSDGNEFYAEITTNNNADTTTGKNNKVTTIDNNNKNNSTDKKPTENNKTYNLDNAILVQTQKISSGELKLYSLTSDGKTIHLFVAEKDGNKFYKEIPGSYIIENIFYADIDGKFGDEIIVHANKCLGDTPYKYENYVLKITTDGFEELFKPSSVSLGFSGTLKDNFSVEITNSKTGLQKTINLQNSSFAEKYWDKDGKVLSPQSKVVFESSFYTFEPNDYDSDGLFEIACTQYVSLTSQQDFVGYARTVLEYDSTTKEVKVVETNFYENQ